MIQLESHLHLIDCQKLLQEMDKNKLEWCNVKIKILAFHSKYERLHQQI